MPLGEPFKGLEKINEKPHGRMVKSSAKSFWEIKGAICTTLCKKLLVMNESRFEMV
jgi:hypothetical protein